MCLAMLVLLLIVWCGWVFACVWGVAIAFNVLGLHLVAVVGAWRFVFCGGYDLLIDYVCVFGLTVVDCWWLLMTLSFKVHFALFVGFCLIWSLTLAARVCAGCCLGLVTIG